MDAGVVPRALSDLLQHGAHVWSLHKSPPPVPCPLLLPATARSSPILWHGNSAAAMATRSLNDGMWTGQAYPLVHKEHAKRSRSAMTGQPSRSDLSRSMSLAEWNQQQQRRISPVRRRSHQNNQLEDFTHVKVSPSPDRSRPH